MNKNDGVFYQYGRDKQLRPIVVINVHKINLKEVLLINIMPLIIVRLLLKYI